MRRGVLAAGAALLAACGSPAPAPSPFAVDADGLAALFPPAAEGPALVNYWATWCQPCVAELPELAEVARETDARVLAVNLDLVSVGGEVADVARFVSERGLAGLVVPVATGDLEALADRFDLPGPIPYTVALDAEGRVVDREERQADRARFEQMLARAR